MPESLGDFRLQLLLGAGTQAERGSQLTRSLSPGEPPCTPLMWRVLLLHKAGQKHTHTNTHVHTHAPSAPAARWLAEGVTWLLALTAKTAGRTAALWQQGFGPGGFCHGCPVCPSPTPRRMVFSVLLVPAPSQRVGRSGADSCGRGHQPGWAQLCPLGHSYQLVSLADRSQGSWAFRVAKGRISYHEVEKMTVFRATLEAHLRAGLRGRGQVQTCSREPHICPWHWPHSHHHLVAGEDREGSRPSHQCPCGTGPVHRGSAACGQGGQVDL